MKKRMLILMLCLTFLISGCGNSETNLSINNTISSKIDIYISDDVDVNGNKIDKNSSSLIIDEYKPSEESSEEITYEQIPASETNIAVHFLDVGQADSVLIQINDKENILIDGGNNGDGEDIVSYLKAYDIENIDSVIATHPHEDHIGGLDDVLNNFSVDNVYMPQLPESMIPTTITYEDFLLAVDNSDALVYPAERGSLIYDANNIKMEIISPTNVESDDLNDYSIVIRLLFKDVSFIFTGDASTNITDEIINNYKGNNYLDCDILKVGHHGSYTSTNEKLLNELTPSYAIIQVGNENQYGHPHTETINLLNNKNIQTYQTKDDGTIIITSDGTNIDISTNMTGDVSLGEKTWNPNLIKTKE